MGTTCCAGKCSTLPVCGIQVAALNQAPEEAAAAPFVRVLAEMFGPEPSAAAVVLPMRPLNRMYAEPARAYVERHGGEVRTGALARVILMDGRVAGVEVRGETVPASRVIAAVPWHALRLLCSPSVPAALERIAAAADAMTSKPIVTVNLWYDRPVMQEPFVGLPGRTIQWVFDKRLAFGEAASHLSLVSSGADAIVHLLKHYAEPGPINIGVGSEVSIRALAETLAAVTGYQGRLTFDAAKPDGMPRKSLDGARLAATGWRGGRPLREGLESAYRYFLDHIAEAGPARPELKAVASHHD